MWDGWESRLPDDYHQPGKKKHPADWYEDIERHPDKLSSDGRNIITTSKDERRLVQILEVRGLGAIVMTMESGKNGRLLPASCGEFSKDELCRGIR
jgi:hypothetical protein